MSRTVSKVERLIAAGVPPEKADAVRAIWKGTPAEVRKLCEEQGVSFFHNRGRTLADYLGWKLAGRGVHRVSAVEVVVLSATGVITGPVILLHGRTCTAYPEGAGSQLRYIHWYQRVKADEV